MYPISCWRQKFLLQNSVNSGLLFHKIHLATFEHSRINFMHQNNWPFSMSCLNSPFSISLYLYFCLIQFKKNKFPEFFNTAYNYSSEE
jgi:hypothetical protein